MATQFITTALTTTQVLADGDTMVLTDLGSIVAATGDGIASSGFSGDVQVFGSVYGEARGIDLVSSTLDAFNVYIGTTGRVVGATSTGLFIDGSGSRISNFGELSGSFYGLYSIGSVYLTNAGVIGSTGVYGAFFDSQPGEVSTIQIDNSGTISGSLEGLATRNSDV